MKFLSKIMGKKVEQETEIIPKQQISRKIDRMKEFNDREQPEFIAPQIVAPKETN